MLTQLKPEDCGWQTLAHGSMAFLVPMVMQQRMLAYTRLHMKLFKVENTENDPLQAEIELFDKLRRMGCTNEYIRIGTI